ncbi:MAG: hypothetical protein ACRDID_10445, partial [Ktedonobacterales bacterium]
AEIAVGALAILGYAAYRRVAHWLAYLLIAVLAAIGATVLAPAASYLVTVPVHHMSVVGIGPLQISLERDTTLVNASAATWALLCGPLGLLVGLGVTAAYLLDAADDKAGNEANHKAWDAATWIGIALMAAAPGLLVGIAVGLLIGALMALPVVGLGWLYGGLIVGAVAGLTASVAVALQDWTIDEKVRISVAILVLVALALGIPLIAITGQSVASVLVWGGGVLAGGIAAAGLVFLVVIADQASGPHPFPEPEPTM